MTITDDETLECPDEASSSGLCTLSETVLSGIASLDLAGPKELPPMEGKTFIIRSHDRRLILELSEDSLQAVSESEAGLGVAWRCIKTNNWYGFINTVSGGRLGYNDGKVFCVSLTNDWDKNEAQSSGTRWASFFPGARTESKDDDKKSLAVLSRHHPWEWFTIDRHEDGGYVLLVVIKGYLYQMAIDEDGSTLVAVEEGGMAWDFVEANITGLSYLFESS